MNNHKLIISLCTVLFLGILTKDTNAQTPNDALRYSQTYFGGTARSMGVAGAFGALGGDPSAMSINPAGLGVYRKSELSFSPSFYFSDTQTEYLGTTSEDNGNHFNFNNITNVRSNAERRARRNNNSEWKAVNTAFGFNRLANYNRNRYIAGQNDATSITEFFASNSFYSDLGATGGLVGYLSDGTAVGVGENGGFYQEEVGSFSKAYDEGFFAIAGNYNDKLYIGATVGVPFVNYESELTFKETDTDDRIPELENFELFESLDVSGVGVNGKFGVSYRINDQFRAGFAAHTPTYLSISEDYQTDLTAEYSENGQINQYGDTQDGFFEYNLTTPWRFVASGAAVVKGLGFASLDVEMVDYSQSYFTFNDNDPDLRQFANDLNQAIEDTYKQAINVRLGAEFAVKSFRLRGGYALYGSPYENGNDGNRQFLTGGLGIRVKGVYADAALVRSLGTDNYQPYAVPGKDVETAEIQNNGTNLVLTVGFNF